MRRLSHLATSSNSESPPEDVAIYTAESSQGRKVGWPAWKQALSDWQKLLILLGQICIVLPVVGFLVFTPVLVGGMGYKGVKANLVSISSEVGDVSLQLMIILDVDHTLLGRLPWAVGIPKELRSLQGTLASCVRESLFADLRLLIVLSQYHLSGCFVSLK